MRPGLKKPAIAGPMFIIKYHTDSAANAIFHLSNKMPLNADQGSPLRVLQSRQVRLPIALSCCTRTGSYLSHSEAFELQ